MLRASALASGSSVDLRAIGDPRIELGIPAGRSLLLFADALINGNGLSDARDQLVAAVGETGAVRAALTVGNFEMMNRVVDATGVPVPAAMREVLREVGLDTGDQA